ncbi:MAG TPA: hypothetical protein VGP72_08380 [Planctomycetota bacterium]|jgi:hypothetical protein
MAKLRDGWNGRGSAAPNQVAITCAQEVLDKLSDLGLAPANVLPSVDEGVGISFSSGKRYALIECYNTGEIAAVISLDVEHVEAWDVTEASLTEAVEKINGHIRANA